MAIKTPLDHLQEWARTKKDIETKLEHAIQFRDRQIASRDRKSAQISLAPNEERMWQKRIDNAQSVVDRLETQLRLLNN